MATVSTLSVPFQNAASRSTPLQLVDPLTDQRWDDLVASHPRASVFHQRGWLEALTRTYGYKPLVLTSAPAHSPMRDGIVFCDVKSWLNGNRLVSLPFSDHCEPLLNESGDARGFVEWAGADCNRNDRRYIELRPLLWRAEPDKGCAATSTFWFHTLDLTPSVEQIFSGFHKNCVQRRIRRAEREPLSYESGTSAQLLDDFYSLLLITRRRHHLLPQPRAWFRNLISCMGQNLTIRVARKNGTAIAALLTLRHRDMVVYKYGCSDRRFHNLAGIPFLFWKLIEESKAMGAREIDFGRSDLDQRGLIAFKDRFGTQRKMITYFRFAKTGKQNSRAVVSAIRQVFSAMPDAAFAWAGGLVYRHLG